MNDARVGIGHIGWKNVEVKAFEEVIEQWKKHPGLLDETMLPLDSERSKLSQPTYGGEKDLFSLLERHQSDAIAFVMERGIEACAHERYPRKHHLHSSD